MGDVAFHGFRDAENLSDPTINEELHERPLYREFAAWRDCHAFPTRPAGAPPRRP